MEQLDIICQSVEGLLGTALPLKKAVDQGCDQRYEYREHKHGYGNTKIQKNCLSAGFDC